MERSSKTKTARTHQRRSHNADETPTVTATVVNFRDVEQAAVAACHLDPGHAVIKIGGATHTVEASPNERVIRNADGLAVCHLERSFPENTWKQRV